MLEALDLLRAFTGRAGLGSEPSFVDVVEAIRAIPYGRPAERSADGVVSEWRGTCSTKHALLIELVSAWWPELEPRVVHRVYLMTPLVARALFGDEVAIAIPTNGLTDVHTYVTVWAGRRVVVDATLPGDGWDGRSDMDLACGDGVDHEGGTNPWSVKSELVLAHCEPEIRDRVIEAITSSGLRDQPDPASATARTRSTASS